jgi:hypothetical protein
MTWGQFESEQRDMAGVLRELLHEAPIAYLATVRRDGSPRMHPICPIFTQSGIYVAVAGSGRQAPSPKRFDLRRDGRFALHALPGPRDAEFYATGRVRTVSAAADLRAIGDAAGHTVHQADEVFEFLFGYVMTAWWEHVGQPNTYAVRREWRAP